MVSSTTLKKETYLSVISHIRALIEGEHDEIAVMATISCELHHRFPDFHWTGFYRCVAPELLKIGPYQGSHGCLSIDFNRGVCGKAARTKKTQVVQDVNLLEYHIACSSSTVSEIVVPILDNQGKVRAVLDIDSNKPSTFNREDVHYLEEICRFLMVCY